MSEMWHHREPRECKPIEVVAQVGFNAQNSINEWPIWAWRHDVKNALMKMYPNHTEKHIELAIHDAIYYGFVKETAGPGHTDLTKLIVT